MKYDLSHLTQGDNPPLGPIQDDEALLLFSVIRVCGLKKVLEFGFGQGDSARNFLSAVGADGHVWSVDIDPHISIAKNHTFIQKDCSKVTHDDIGQDLDFIFFDCHNYGQMEALGNLGISKHTIIALHDTGLHAKQNTGEAYGDDETGWVHQPVEREMRILLCDQGWKRMDFCGYPRLPMRHGITLLQWR